jgi:hypothetical protein
VSEAHHERQQTLRQLTVRELALVAEHAGVEPERLKWIKHGRSAVRQDELAGLQDAFEALGVPPQRWRATFGHPTPGSKRKSLEVRELCQLADLSAVPFDRLKQIHRGRAALRANECAPVQAAFEILGCPPQHWRTTFGRETLFELDTLIAKLRPYTEASDAAIARCLENRPNESDCRAELPRKVRLGLESISFDDGELRDERDWGSEESLDISPFEEQSC